MKVRVAWVFLISCCSWQVKAQESTPTLSTIEAAWKQQEQVVNSMRVSWTEKRTLAQGSISALIKLLPVDKESGDLTSKVIPPKDTTLDIPCYLAISTSQIRFETAIPDWSEQLQAFRMTRVRESLDEDGAFRQNTIHSRDDGMRSSGVINRPSGGQAFRSAQVWPILTTVRGNDKRLTNFQLSSFVVTNRNAIIQKIPCIELDDVAPGTSVKRRVWVSPKKGYSIIRSVMLVNGKVIKQVTVDQRLYDNRVWLPHSWEVTNSGTHGTANETIRSTVEKYELNPEFDRSHFSLTFPEGTSIHDAKTKKWSKETGVFNETKLPSIGEDPPPRWWKSYYWFFGFGILFALLSLAWGLRFRKLRSIA